MKAKEFIIVEAKMSRKDKQPVKTRNPVAKNLGVTASGAGQHKDRKAAMKRGEVKHKAQSLGESETQSQIQSRIDHNKKLLAAAKQQGWTSTVRDIEAAIEKLQAQLGFAPTERPAVAARTPMPKGYKYEPYREEEPDGDNVKIFHYITLPNGKRVSVPFSPYKEMTGKDVELWVKLGMPTKAHGGNFDSQRLQQMASSVGESQVSEVDMSSPEFQRLLKSVGEKAKQGPKKTVYDPRTGKYKVVPVNPQGNKNG